MAGFPLLVATDLDGTIIRSDGTISPRTVAAFARVEAAGRTVRAGHRAAAAGDGADRGGIRAPGDGDLRQRGALLRHADRDRRGAAPDPAASSSPPRLRRCGPPCPASAIAVEYPDGHAADLVYQALNWDVNSSLPRVADDVLFARPASKLLGRHFGYTCDDLLALALPALDGLVSVTHSNSKGLVEAAALGVSKATVVAELAAAHGIGRESVIAFGDMPNDLPLLAWAGTSCAVANAHPEVLAAASHVIGGNDEDGVAAYLERLYA